MNKKTIAIIATIVFIIVATAYYFLYPVNQIGEDNRVIGGDKDEHGCLPAAGYSWCEADRKCVRQWEDGCRDSIADLFELIESQMNIDFFEPIDTEMDWFVESEEGADRITLGASVINASMVSSEDFEKIKKIIEQEGFEEDNLNAKGGIGEFHSYRKNSLRIVCDLNGFFSDFDPENQQYEPQTDKKDIELVCAVLSEKLEPEISTAKRIKKILAAKYDTKISQIEVSITHEDEDHARGNISFQPEGEGGMFLAVRVGGEWQLVYDGNGSVDCGDLSNYNFSREMLVGFCD